jgi:hypothetical protein
MPTEPLRIVRDFDPGLFKEKHPFRMLLIPRIAVIGSKGRVAWSRPARPESCERQLIP